MSIENIIVTITLGLTILVVAFLFQRELKKKWKNQETEEVKKGEMGCSILFYLSLGLLLFGFLIAYVYYKNIGN